MVKVLFVCTGNICRSPTAAGLMQAHVERAGLAHRIEVDAAGTHGYHVGEPPDPRSVAEARRRRIDISHLRARQVSPADFDSADLILALDRGHQQQLLAMAPPGRAERVHLLLSFAPGCGRSEVPDPYYGDETFPGVFDLIEQGVTGLLAHLRRHHLGPVATPP